MSGGQIEINNRLITLLRKRGIKLIFLSETEAKELDCIGYYRLGTIAVATKPLPWMLPVLCHEIGHMFFRQRALGKYRYSNTEMARLPLNPYVKGDPFLDDFEEEAHAWKFAERLINLMIKSGGETNVKQTQR